MRKFPRFLQKNPTFFGLELTDLFLLLLLFQVSSFLGTGPLVGLVVSFALVLSIKYILKNMDFIGFLMGERNKSLSWMNELKEKGL